MIRLSILLRFALLLFLLGSIPTPAEAQTGGGLNFIFAENTSDEYIEEVYQNRDSGLNPLFELANHWDPTATATNDGASSAQGESLTLTWSIVPDGTFIDAGAGEPDCDDSDLIMIFNARYGNGVWQAELAKVFEDWSDKTGNNYIFEANDDGANWPDSDGQLGVRGDIRIGGCPIDGNSGILAYNYFPDNGDMKIDTNDNFFSGPTSPRLHNVVSHEHGHGAGVDHVCPTNNTKLMEPTATTSFTGLQHDDIRAIQRHYGDRNEHPGGNGNNTVAQASDLGTLINNVEVTTQTLSIDDNLDTDWFQFTLTEAVNLDVTLTPTGTTYLSGPQLFPSGNCSSGSTVNSLAMHNLGFEIVDSDMSTVLVTVNANGSGLPETATDFLIATPGTKYLHVFGNNVDNIQLYNLQLTATDAVNLALSKTPSPDPAIVGQPLTYTLRVTGTGSLTATNVIITDTVPANTSLNPASLSGNFTYTGVTPGSVITWSTALSLTLNQSLARSFMVTVTNGLKNGTLLTNTAYVSASNLPKTLAQTRITVIAAPELTATITSLPGVIQSDTALITYTIRLQNIGAASATAVLITNTIPGSTTYVAASASEGGVENSGIITWSGGTIPPDAVITRTFQVTVSTPLTNGEQLINTLVADSAQKARLEATQYIQIVSLPIFLPIIHKQSN